MNSFEPKKESSSNLNIGVEKSDTFVAETHVSFSPWFVLFPSGNQGIQLPLITSSTFIDVKLGK